LEPDPFQMNSTSCPTTVPTPSRFRHFLLTAM
jgi:hypothetical protein